jgi:ATP-dependent protease HslVU (ClpYQ) peptidase subunit
MTCVVGLVEDGVLLIGADSAGVDSHYNIEKRADSKVFRSGPYLMGYTTSFRMGQLLRFALKPPAPPDKNGDLFRFMVTDFIDSVRTCFAEGGYQQKKDEREAGGTFIVGVKNRLFQIENDYQVGIPHNPYAAVGCGWAYALGSLATSSHCEIPPKTRVKLALQAAAEFNGGVCPPFRIMRQ